MHELIVNELLPAARNWTAGLDAAEISIDPDRETLIFGYPRALDESDYSNLSYVRPSVRLELGATSDHEPATTRAIQPYAAESYPDLFQQPDCSVRALVPERTFWEKITLLHVEPDRPPPSRARSWQRTSRHLYDIHMLAAQGVADAALDQIDLLDRVCAYKSVYFRSGWANYASALTPEIRIRPRGDFEHAMRADYSDMQQMFFGEVPRWEAILEGLDQLEGRIRRALR